MKNIFNPKDAPAKVISVDSGTVTVKVLVPENMQKFAVNKLVAVNGAMGQLLMMKKILKPYLLKTLLRFLWLVHIMKRMENK